MVLLATPVKILAPFDYSVCPKSSGLFAKDFACIGKVVARKKVSKIWRLSVVS
jgi:hypothetical protein